MFSDVVWVGWGIFLSFGWAFTYSSVRCAEQNTEFVIRDAPIIADILRILFVLKFSWGFLTAPPTLIDECTL